MSKLGPYEITVTLQITVDADAWINEYDNPGELTEDVVDYFRAAILGSAAGGCVKHVNEVSDV